MTGYGTACLYSNGRDFLFFKYGPWYFGLIDRAWDCNFPLERFYFRNQFNCAWCALSCAPRPFPSQVLYIFIEYGFVRKSLI